MRKDIETAVLEDLAGAADYWKEKLCDVVTNPAADLHWVTDEAPYRRIQQVIGKLEPQDRRALEAVVSDCLEGLMHSALCVFDGATASAEVGRVVIVDTEGNEMEDDDWHSAFIGHLYDTGRKEASDASAWPPDDGRVDPYANEP